MKNYNSSNFLIIVALCLFKLSSIYLLKVAFKSVYPNDGLQIKKTLVVMFVSSSIKFLRTNYSIEYAYN